MSDSLKPIDRDLGNGLRLRSISPADTDALTEFATRVFGHQTGEPDVMAGIWAGELSRGDHPTVPPDDGVIVVDTATGADRLLVPLYPPDVDLCRHPVRRRPAGVDRDRPGIP